MTIWDLIKHDTDRRHAQFVDWDTGIATYLMVDEHPLDPREEYGADEDSPDTEAYFDGEVYGVIVVDQDSEPIIDLWGCYGYDYAKDAAREQHDYYVKQASDAAEAQRAEDESIYQLGIAP